MLLAIFHAELLEHIFDAIALHFGLPLDSLAALEHVEAADQYRGISVIPTLESLKYEMEFLLA